MTPDANGYLSHRQILVVMAGLMVGMATVNFAQDPEQQVRDPDRVMSESIGFSCCSQKHLPGQAAERNLNGMRHRCSTTGRGYLLAYRVDRDMREEPFA